MLWETLAGRHPFRADNVGETSRRIQAGAPPLADVRPDLPESLRRAVASALILNPARRPEAGRLATELRAQKQKRKKRKIIERREQPAPGLERTRVALRERLLPGALAAVWTGWAADVAALLPCRLGAAARRRCRRARARCSTRRHRSRPGRDVLPAREHLARPRHLVRSARGRLAGTHLARSTLEPAARRRAAARTARRPGALTARGTSCARHCAPRRPDRRRRLAGGDRGRRRAPATAVRSRHCAARASGSPAAGGRAPSPTRSGKRSPSIRR